MQDRDLYARILGLVVPWKVRDVKLDLGGEVRVIVPANSGAQLSCPECGKTCPGYDVRERSWRHLDTCQVKTILVADVPRVNCAEHGVKQVRVPWAEPGSGFTVSMKAVVIDWRRSLASIKAVAEQLRLSWDQVDGIMARAVTRALLRRKTVSLRRLGVDETSFQRRHEYVTIVTDLDGGVVLHVADDRKRESLDAFFRSLTAEQPDAMEVVAMDIWAPFISSASEHVPDADSLKGSRYIWLTNPHNLDAAGAGALNALHQMNMKTSRTWALKKTAMCIWRFVQRGRALKEWTAWLSKAMRSRLEPVKKIARMIRKHLWGIVNAMALRKTNAGSESVNAKVQRVKRTACGCRNRERFRNAILFHLGGLDLYPWSASATQTDS